MRRFPHVDWLRGLAVVIMIEAHTIDAWTVTDEAVRGTAFYKVLQFIAGWAAPLFLFLAGVSVALAAAAHLKKGKSVAEASWLVQKRGWQVLGLALLFRLQSFLLSPTSTAESLLKVDILNVMGVAMVLAAWCWARGTSNRARDLWLLIPAALCLFLAQFAPAWSWLEPLGRLQEYIRFTEEHRNFSLLPWGGFVFVGAWLGRQLLAERDAAEERSFYVRLGSASAALAAAAFLGQFLPTFTPHSTYWHSSTMLCLGWLWMRRPRADRWSPMVLFGKTSLFVYWVHVEIVYGFPTYPLRHELSVAGALIAYGVFTLFMLGLAMLWNRRERGPLIPQHLRITSWASAPR
jgi:uncharacterized membrane protein